MPNHKCYFDEQGVFHACTGMDYMLELDSHIEVKTLFSFKDGKMRDLGPTIRRTKKKQGLVLSFCPFCQQPVDNSQNNLSVPKQKIPYYPKEAGP
jgi:hypothetical protein